MLLQSSSFMKHVRAGYKSTSSFNDQPTVNCSSNKAMILYIESVVYTLCTLALTFYGYMLMQCMHTICH